MLSHKYLRLSVLLDRNYVTLKLYIIIGLMLKKRNYVYLYWAKICEENGNFTKSISFNQYLIDELGIFSWVILGCPLPSCNVERIKHQTFCLQVLYFCMFIGVLIFFPLSIVSSFYFSFSTGSTIFDLLE